MLATSQTAHQVQHNISSVRSAALVETTDADGKDCRYDRCVDPPGQTGDTKRDEAAALRSHAPTNTTRIHPRDLEVRQSSKGGFLDASIYQYFGCQNDNDLNVYDPCAQDDSDCPNALEPPAPIGEMASSFDPLPVTTVSPPPGSQTSTTAPPGTIPATSDPPTSSLPSPSLAPSHLPIASCDFSCTFQGNQNTDLSNTILSNVNAGNGNVHYDAGCKYTYLSASAACHRACFRSTFQTVHR